VTPPERRTRVDLAVTAVIAVIVLAVAVGTWYLSEARNTDHTTAVGTHGTPPTEAGAPPASLTERWHAHSTTTSPVVLDGMVVATDDHTVTALDSATGDEAWHYTRDRQLCGATAGWSRVLAVYRGREGCGEVTSFSIGTGEYVDTRSGPGPDAPSHADIFRSLDHVGLLSDNRVELWRSDLVRTVESGDTGVLANPGTQPTAGCRYVGALTRKDLLATTMDCPDRSGRLVSLQEADPDEAAEPAVLHDFSVPDGSELVAVAQQAALIYVPGGGEGGDGARFQVLRTDGSYDEYPADGPAADLDGSTTDNGLFVPETSDLPHHMTWFDGHQVTGFGPDNLDPRFRVTALGTGADMGGRLLVPVDGGIAVVDWENGAVERTLPVDRGGYTGPVSLRVQGSTVIEQRGDELVGLSADA
jgi:hypothetical protein